MDEQGFKCNASSEEDHGGSDPDPGADGVSDTAVNEALPFWGFFDPEIRYSGFWGQPGPDLWSEPCCSVPPRTGMGGAGMCGYCVGGLQGSRVLSIVPVMLVMLGRRRKAAG